MAKALPAPLRQAARCLAFRFFAHAFSFVARFALALAIEAV